MGHEHILIFVVLLVGLYMSWNIGANDVSNAMGTSVGSGALTLGKAILVAAVLEFAGAFFLGGGVSKTVQQGLLSPAYFAHEPNLLLYGMLASLIATALWLQVASYFGWPVSTTHAIIGAVLGFGLLAGDLEAIKWMMVLQMSLSWIVSPLVSGIFAFILFSILQRKILSSLQPINASVQFIPYLTGVVVALFTLSLLFNGIGTLKFYPRPVHALLLAIGLGAIAYLVAYLLVRRVARSDTAVIANSAFNLQTLSLSKALRYLKRAQLFANGDRKIQVKGMIREIAGQIDAIKSGQGAGKGRSEYQVVEKMFASLQILSASYVAFAHGANDIANAIGPVAAAIDLIRYQSVTFHPTISPYLLAMGGIGIVVGLATWGWRVMETIGRKITELTPSRGFSAEFGAALTILFASKLGLPISTTHCIVGAVLGVGLARGLGAVNLRTLRDIALSWLVTLPSSALASMLIFYLLRTLFLT